MKRFRYRWLTALAVTALAGQAAPASGGPSIVDRRPRLLDIGDVLGMAHLDQAALSPDGLWVAAIIQRPAGAGEVYGRTAYETDPSRNDIRLISRLTGKRQNITHGAATAAGCWCAAWSPDGNRLAMLSTQPEHGETHGGDNVRLYVWNRSTGSITRMSDAAVMTQTRYGAGSHRLDLRGGADGSSMAHSCGLASEGAPFLWLDNDHLLAVMLPTGQVSGLIDEYNRPFRQEESDAKALHDGNAATVMAVGSGAARVPADEAANSAILRTINVTTRAERTVATVLAYPFRGELTISVSPDLRRLAVLASVGAFAPQAERVFPHINADSYTVEKRLGFVDLSRGSAIRWVAPPPEGQAPLELYGWSPDGRMVALRARSGPFASDTPLFIASADDGSMKRLGTRSVGGRAAGSNDPHEEQALWIDGNRLLARFADVADASRSDWSIVGTDGKETNLSAKLKTPPQGFRLAQDGRWIAVADGSLLALDLQAKTLVSLAKVAPGSTIGWPIDPAIRTPRLLLETDAPNNARHLQPITVDGASAGPGFDLSASASLVDANLAQGVALSSDGTTDGLFLRQTDLANARSGSLLSLDTNLASFEWGKRILIDYRGADGAPLKGVAILPPGYTPGRRYPTLVWVYEGYALDGIDGEYFTDPRMPGIYNLQVYAAHGYVVLVPSMPTPPEAQRGDVYKQVSAGVMPAIGRLVALGIADPDRLGVFGQSYGGYSVYALITQTNRFKAAVAMAGITDLTSFYNQFDPNAHGYPGIEHEMSANPPISDQFGRHVPPYRDYAGYWRNSPLAYVDQVQTPLLMIHGEHDDRGSVGQAESFFSSLYAQGKTARLLRYGGETHSLAQSPANIRDISAETISWFDKYVKGGNNR